MLRSYLIFAFRLFLKDSVYSLLNLLGLALGITVGMILLLFLQDELSYDQHYTRHKQIHRFTNHLLADGADFNTARTARELAPILKEELPELLEYVRIVDYPYVLVEYRDAHGETKQFYEDGIRLADQTFFTFFDHEFDEGDPAVCLSGPGKAAITRSVAAKYFGDEEALGKVLRFPDNELREITAVISDVPENSHLKYDILLSDIPVRGISTEENPTRYSEAFWNPESYTYLLFPVDYDTSNFHARFPAIYDKTFALFGQQINGSVNPSLQQIADIHFNSDRAGDEPVGNLSYVYTFAAVGIFIMLLACINYTNMATARSVIRTGEMGVRKILGSTRKRLFFNVLLEALLLAVGGMLLAVCFSYIILELTPFNALIEKNLSLNFIHNPLLLFGTIGVTLVVGLLSGIYPALYIPSVPVAVALKGTFTGHRFDTIIRKSLIVFQFAISLFVIICTVLMDRQIDYMSHQELGFEKENVLIIEIRDTTTANHIAAIKAELLQNPDILNAATAYATPGMGVGGHVFWVEKDSAMAQQSMSVVYAGPDYVETMGFELVKGRGFRKGSQNEFYNSFLVNEAGVKFLGWGDEAIGKKTRYYHSNNDNRVIGVVRDFNFESLHTQVDPLFIVLESSNGGRMHIRIRGNDIPATINYIEDVWTKFDTRHPFEYTFLDQEFARQYRADQTQQRLISLLAYICIFISLLGLVGLSAFTVSRKAKEVSIRKVLGAGVGSIVMLFSRDYFRLILIAFLISVPFAHYLMDEWLSGFAYRMPIRWYYFVLPGSLVLFLGLFTVAMQSLKSAKHNPVQGLRSE